MSLLLGCLAACRLRRKRRVGGCEIEGRKKSVTCVFCSMYISSVCLQQLSTFFASAYPGCTSVITVPHHQPSRRETKVERCGGGEFIFCSIYKFSVENPSPPQNTAKQTRWLGTLVTKTPQHQPLKGEKMGTEEREQKNKKRGVEESEKSVEER